MLRSSIIRRISNVNNSGIIASFQSAITEQSTKVIASTPDPISSSSASATDAFVMANSVAAKKLKPINTPALTPEELAAASEPSLYSQVMNSDLICGFSDFMWATFGLGAGDVGAIFFCSLYGTGTYFDRRTRLKKSRFASLISALCGAFPYYFAFWLWKKYLAYIMDVPDMRSGVSSVTGEKVTTLSWQRQEQLDYASKRQGKLSN